MSEATYGNVVPRAISRSAHKDKNIHSADNRDGVCIMVLLSVLLMLSLLANAMLAYLYYSTGPERQMSCEPVTHCSYSDVDHNAQIEQIVHKDMENRSQSQSKNCPKKNFPEEWFQQKGRFYVFSTDTMDWYSSRERCQDLGGDLVIINSNKEQEFLARQIRNISANALYWIGLTDSRTEGVWLWVDDTKNNLSLWAMPPDDHKSADNPLGEDCVIMNGKRTDSKWGDVFCSRKERRICEIPCT
ncbi:galactose-specific lectin nattectin-like [Pseudorasbora parva]|uniref:galactose-specific lectin nattectin-like n=1 Tax=Pseudorasbora parva TaxID=51549 RepID=UPI00351E4DF4